MTAAANPQFIRKTLKLELINKAPLKHAHDDVWTFNSQCSSQWDGLRHYAYQESGVSLLLDVIDRQDKLLTANSSTTWVGKLRTLQPPLYRMVSNVSPPYLVYKIISGVDSYYSSRCIGEGYLRQGHPHRLVRLGLKTEHASRCYGGICHSLRSARRGP